MLLPTDQFRNLCVHFILFVFRLPVRSVLFGALLFNPGTFLGCAVLPAETSPRCNRPPPGGDSRRPPPGGVGSRRTPEGVRSRCTPEGVRNRPSPGGVGGRGRGVGDRGRLGRGSAPGGVGGRGWSSPR